MAKHDLIRQHMEVNGWISGSQAMNLYNVYRLSSVINRFRKAGMNIATEMVATSRSEHARYHLVDARMVSYMRANGKRAVHVNGVHWINDDV